jgi:hypothetical protein
MKLDDGNELTLVNGTLSFGRNAELAIETAGARNSKDRRASDFGSSHILKISGPLDGLKVSVEKTGLRQPAD